MSEIEITGFADEVSESKRIDEQLGIVSALGLKYFTIRFVDAGKGVKNVLDLDGREIDSVLGSMDRFGMAVSSIGSPIGKVKIVDVVDGTDNRYRSLTDILTNQVGPACQVAKQLNCQLIRGFSFYPPLDSDARDYLELASDQLKAIAEACGEEGLMFGLEVEANLIGNRAEVLCEIHDRVGLDSLALIFDGGNLVTQGFDESQIESQFLQMLPRLGWIHIKDYQADAATRPGEFVDEEKLAQFVPPSQGGSGHRTILKHLKDNLPLVQQRLQRLGIATLFADLEPHLKGGGQFGGYSGPDGFGVACRDFCQLLQEAGLSYQLRQFKDW